MSPQQALKTERSLEVEVDNGTEDELSTTGASPPQQSSTNLLLQQQRPPPAKLSASQMPSLRPGAILVKKKSDRTPSTETQIPLACHMRNAFLPGDPPVPTTPHMIRALQQRRSGASATTGRSRRRNGQPKRETPRDALRSLGRILSKTSALTAPSLTPSRNAFSLTGSVDHDDELGEDLDTLKPTLTFPLEEEAIDEIDESFYIAPPNLSLPVDTNEDVEKSVEIGRRLDNQRFELHPSKGSFGGAQSSGRFVDSHDLTSATIVRTAQKGEILLFLPGDDGGDLDNIDFFVRSGNESKNQEPRDHREKSLRRRGSIEDNHSGYLFGDGKSSPFAFDIPSSGSKYPASEMKEVAQDRRSEMPSIAGEIKVAKKKTKGTTMEPKSLNVSSHGVTYTPVSASFVRRFASRFSRRSEKCKAPLGKESIQAVTQASNWFFEQLGADLGAFADHAKRKNIDESDVTAIMRRGRQRQLKVTQTPFSVAQRYLPRELLQDLRLRPCRFSRARVKLRRKSAKEDLRGFHKST